MPTRGPSLFNRVKTPESSSSTLDSQPARGASIKSNKDAQLARGSSVKSNLDSQLVRGSSVRSSLDSQQLIRGASVKSNKFQASTVQTLTEDDNPRRPSLKQVVSVIEHDEEEDKGGIGCAGILVVILSVIVCIITFPFSLIFCVKVVREYERAVIFRLGRLWSKGDKGPGVVMILPCIDNFTNVDMRTISFDIPAQEIITRDSVAVTVEALVYYRIKSAYMSITKVGNPYTATALMAQTMVRNVIGSKTVSEIILDRISLCHEMKISLDEVTRMWGISIERIELKDLKLPPELQKALSAEVEAETETKAKLKAAEGEQQASNALLKASEIIGKSPTAMQLRYLQTLNKIAVQKNSTIIFPVPVDLMPQMSPRTW